MYYIYFLRDPETSWIKIGYTKNLKQRMNSHRTSNPRLMIVRSIPTKFGPKIEAVIKGMFWDKLLEGEHFNLSESDIELAIEKILELNEKIIPEEEIDLILGVERLTTERPASNYENELFSEYLQIKIKKNEYDTREEILKRQIINAIGNARGILGMATFEQRIYTSIDQDRLREEMPEIYEKYKRSTKTRVLRIRRTYEN